MIKRLFPIILISYFFSFYLSAQSTIKLEKMSLFERTFSLTSDSIGSIIQLPDSFITSGTDSVWLDSIRLSPKQDYSLDLIRGRLILKKKHRKK